MLSKIEQIKNDLIANSQDAELAGRLIESLLSMKGQYDVEEVVFVVPQKDIVKEYDNENLVIIRCKDKFVWKHRGGFGFFVDYRMKTLYEFMDNLCSMKDHFEELSEEEKSVYNGLYFGMSLVSELPMFVCVSDELFFNVVSTIMEELKKMDEQSINAKLQEETPEENAEFEAKMQAAEEVLKDGGNK